MLIHSSPTGEQNCAGTVINPRCIARCHRTLRMNVRFETCKSRFARLERVFILLHHGGVAAMSNRYTHDLIEKHVALDGLRGPLLTTQCKGILVSTGYLKQ